MTPRPSTVSCFQINPEGFDKYIVKVFQHELVIFSFLSFRTLFLNVLAFQMIVSFFADSTFQVSLF